MGTCEAEETSNNGCGRAVFPQGCTRSPRFANRRAASHYQQRRVQSIGLGVGFRLSLTRLPLSECFQEGKEYAILGL